MNKERTCMTDRIKFTLFASLATVLLLASNTKSVARTIEPMMEDSTQITVLPEVKAVEQEEKVYKAVIVQVQPEYPGGKMALLQHLAKNIKYPASAQMQKIQGKVVVQFIVEKDGSMSNIKVARGLHPDLDEEALRVFATIPNKWTPGKQGGKPVRTQMTLPVTFQLN